MTPARRGSAGRDFLTAISLSNLSLLREWNALLNYTAADAFFFEHRPSISQFAAIFLAVLLLGAFFFGLIRLSRQIRDRLERRFCIPFVLAAALPPANAIRRVSHLSGLRLGEAPALPAILLAIAFLAGISVWIWLDPRSLRFGASAALLFLPLIAVEFFLALQHEFRNPNELADPAFASLAPRRALPLPRIVWVVFDDLDYRLLFQDRPAGLPMPAFDRMRKQSLFAADAFSPAIITQESIPSLLTGAHIRKFSSENEISRDDSVKVSEVARLPTVFTATREMGGNASVVGWYLPYSRLFGQDLAACSWRGLGFTVNLNNGGILKTSLRLAQIPFELALRSPFGPSMFIRQHVEVLESLHAEMLHAAVDSRMDLVFLHFPTAHPPHVYDRFKHAFTRATEDPAGYPNSLALSDQWLADLRSAMEAANVWSTTNVLVTSDHHFREDRGVDGKTDLRVPFLLKLAGQISPLTYTAPLHTIVTKSLLEAILRREVVSPDEAVHWLSAHSSN